MNGLEMSTKSTKYTYIKNEHRPSAPEIHELVHLNNNNTISDDLEPSLKPKELKLFNQYYDSVAFRLFKQSLIKDIDSITINKITQPIFKKYATEIKNHLNNCKTTQQFNIQLRKTLIKFTSEIYVKMEIVQKMRNISIEFEDLQESLNNFTKIVVLSSIHESSLKGFSLQSLFQETNTFNHFMNKLNKETNETQSISIPFNDTQVNLMHELVFPLSHNKQMITFAEFFSLQNLKINETELSRKECIGMNKFITIYEDGIHRKLETSEFIKICEVDKKGNFSGFGIQQFFDNGRIIVGNFNANSLLRNSDLPTSGRILYYGDFGLKTYKGQISKIGAPTLNGILTLSDGRIFSGEIKIDGNINEKIPGTLILPNKNIFKGNVTKEGKMGKWGQLQIINNRSWSNQFIDGKPIWKYL